MYLYIHLLYLYIHLYFHNISLIYQLKCNIQTHQEALCRGIDAAVYPGSRSVGSHTGLGVISGIVRYRPKVVGTYINAGSIESNLRQQLPGQTIAQSDILQPQISTFFNPTGRVDIFCPRK